MHSIEPLRQSVRNKGYVVFALFILFITFTRIFPVFPERAAVYILLLFLAVLAFPLRGEGVRGKAYIIFDVLLIIATVAFGLYLIFNYKEIISRQGAFTVTDVALGATAVIVTLELTRRVMFPLFLICLAFVVYMIAGEYVPGIFGTPGYSIDRIVGQLSLTMQGLFGVGLNVIIKYVIPFIIFGCLLRAAGIMEVFASLASLILRKSAGGPAKLSILTSSFFGMLSGSAIANVAFTGIFTIPLMKKYGYRSSYAGAVEACASNGGQMTPPIMGSAAFLMADYTGISYIRIILAAVLPALLYFAALFIRVHFKAKQLGLDKRTEDLGIINTGFSKLIPKLVPIVIIMTILLAGLVMWTPTRAVLVATAAAIPLSFLHRDSRLTPKKILGALRESTETSMVVAVSCIAIGIIMGVASLTGIGLKFSELMVSASGQNLFALLLLAAIACIILGMGVATTIVYIFMAIMLAPALVGLGIPLLSAHFFLLYAALLASITPPVCIASYAAAGVAGESPMKVAWEAVSLGVVSFILPFIVIFKPEVLLEGNILSIITTFLFMMAAVLGFSFALGGYINRSLTVWERILFGAVGLAMLLGNYAISLVALAIGSMLIVMPVIRKRRSPG